MDCLNVIHYIVMSSQDEYEDVLHVSWRVGAFAFRPLEYNASMDELEVEWYWQPKQKHNLHDSVSLTTLPLSSQGLDSTTDGST